MRVAFDENGYSFDVDTGNYVSLIYDENGFAYDAATGEQIEEVITDGWGGTVYTGSGGVNWNDVIHTAAQAYAAGEGAAQSGHYIPTQGSQSPQGYRTTGAGVTVTGGAGRGGLGAGLNISTNTLLIVAVVIGAFVFGGGGRRR